MVVKIITIYLPDALTTEFVLGYLVNRIKQVFSYDYIYIGYCSYELLRLLSERYEVVENGDRVVLVTYPRQFLGMLAAIIEGDNTCYAVEARYDIGPQYIDSEWGIEDE